MRNPIPLDQVIAHELSDIALRREEPDLKDPKFRTALDAARQAADLVEEPAQTRTFDVKWREEYEKICHVPQPPTDGSNEVASIEPEQPKAARQQAPLAKERSAARDKELTGLALSGGGIRSATFCLGVLQGLADLGLFRRFDYLSTVSGGGYIGGWLAAWIKREGCLKTVEEQLRGSRIDQAEGRPNGLPSEEEPAPLQHLRSYSNYLAPRLGVGSPDCWVLLATYFRNFVLNQLLLITTLLAVLLLPRLFMLFYDWDGEPAPAIVTSVLGILTGALVLIAGWFINHALQRLRVQGRSQNATLQDGVMRFRLLILAPLCLAAFLVCWFAGDNPADPGFAGKWALFRWLTDRATWWLGALIVGGVAAPVFGAFYIVEACRLFDGQWRRSVWWAVTGIFSAFAGGAGLGVLMYFAYQNMQGHAEIGRSASEAAAVVTFGPPVVLGVLILTTILRVGLLGSYLAEPECEWWGSLNGYLLRHAVVWLLVCGIALFGVPLLILGGSVVQMVLGAGWLTTSIGGVLAGRSPSTGDGHTNRVLDVFTRVAPYIFVIGLAFLLSALISVLLDNPPNESVAHPNFRVVQSPADPPTRVTQSDGNTVSRTSEYLETQDEPQIRLWRYWAGMFCTPMKPETGNPYCAKNPGWLALKTSLWCAGLLLTALFFSWCVGVNTFSLQWIYGNRLIRCYLGASRKKDEQQSDQLEGMPTNVGSPSRNPNPITGFDPADDLPLQDLRIAPPLPAEMIADRPGDKRPYRGPYLLINTAMNLVHGDELAWQERKAEAFLLSPVFCGSKGTDYRKLPEYAGGLSLGTAVTISGAAASPNMGYHSSPAVTALLTLFNVRLGAWTGNPHEKMWKHGEPQMSLFLLFKELFGRTDRRSNYVYLSDGGHFENLGVYELVRRQCRFIVAVDADEDREYAFDDLGGLIRKCRTDLGVPIEIDVTPIKRDANGRSPAHCAVGQIRYDYLYPKAMPGILVYVKTSLTGDEPGDVLNYNTDHPDFPHQPTLDQFFTESQFESYRALGEHVAGGVWPELGRSHQRRHDDRCGSSRSGEPRLRSLAKHWSSPATRKQGAILPRKRIAPTRPRRNVPVDDLFRSISLCQGVCLMPNILNATLPLKQDAASQAKIKAFAAQFATAFWPKVSQVLHDSHMVYYARFTITSDNRWLQILTEYDTDFQTYSNYFADNLKDFFGEVFSVVEGAPSASDAGNRDVFFKWIKAHDLDCLGKVYFSAFGELGVKDMQAKLGVS